MPGARSSCRSVRPGPLYGVAGTSGWVSRLATSNVARTPVAFSTAVTLVAVRSAVTPGRAGRHPVQVVGVVHADVQLHQPAGRCGHHPELAAAVLGGEPAVLGRGQAELGVVISGIGDVRYAHGDRGQAVQAHR